MRRPRLHSLRNALCAVLFAGATILTMTGQAAATGPWQSWGDYDCHDRWHDASWWLQYRHAWVAAHHPEWTESYAQTFGQIGDYDRLHKWHYGDGGFDRNPTGLPADEMTSELSKARERHLNLRPSTAFAHSSKHMKTIDPKSSGSGRDAGSNLSRRLFRQRQAVSTAHPAIPTILMASMDLETHTTKSDKLIVARRFHEN